MAHRIEWCVLHEIAIASAEPKLAPVFTTSRVFQTTRSRTGGSPSNTWLISSPLIRSRPRPSSLFFTAAAEHLLAGREPGTRRKFSKNARSRRASRRGHVTRHALHEEPSEQRERDRFLGFSIEVDVTE